MSLNNLKKMSKRESKKYYFETPLLMTPNAKEFFFLKEIEKGKWKTGWIEEGTMRKKVFDQFIKDNKLTVVEFNE